MRRNKSEHIGEVIEQYIDALKLRAKMRQFHAKKYWHELMGPAISKHTKYLYFKGGKLFVAIDSPVLKNELMMNRQKIRQTINNKVGGDIIEEIIFR